MPRPKPVEEEEVDEEVVGEEGRIIARPGREEVAEDRTPKQGQGATGEGEWEAIMAVVLDMAREAELTMEVVEERQVEGLGGVMEVVQLVAMAAI